MDCYGEEIIELYDPQGRVELQVGSDIEYTFKDFLSLFYNDPYGPIIMKVLEREMAVNEKRKL